MDLRERDFLLSCSYFLLRFLSFCWRLVSTESSLDDDDEEDDDEEESESEFNDELDPDSDELELELLLDEEELLLLDESDLSFNGRAWFCESDGKL